MSGSFGVMISALLELVSCLCFVVSGFMPCQGLSVLGSVASIVFLFEVFVSGSVCDRVCVTSGLSVSGSVPCKCNFISGYVP